MKKILMVASAGGHWVQLNRLRSAVEGQRLIYVATNPELAVQNKDYPFFSVPDASRWDKVRVLLLACKMLWVLLKVRPDVVVSTGALPGFFALFIGKKIGARTVWLDSIANSDKLSMSGRKVGKYADLWLTQWEHLAHPEGPHYFGSVL